MIKAILFDFDGTLIDSNKNTLEYFKATLRHYNHPIPADERFESLWGLKSIDMWKNLLPNISDEEIQKLLLHGKQESLKTITDIQLFPDVQRVLKQLAKQYQLGLVTSRGKKSTKQLLAYRELDPLFSVVIDREDVASHKPHPEGLQLAMDQLNTSISQTVYVGDSEADVLASRNAGIISILLSQLTENFGADYHITEITKLPALIKKL